MQGPKPSNEKRRNGASARYVPNRLPADQRLWNVTLGLYLVFWSGWGFYTDRISLWGRRIQIAELKSGTAWLMAAAFACGALVLLSAVVDHYDQRNNEQAYKAFRWMVVRLGWCLAAASLTAHVYLFFSGAYAVRP